MPKGWTLSYASSREAGEPTSTRPARLTRSLSRPGHVTPWRGTGGAETLHPPDVSASPQMSSEASDRAGTKIWSVPPGPELPSRSDDPQLENWYHTIELGNGLVSRGFYDHRPVVNCYGLPDSLCGKTALDIGTADGFWAFEMERRGAE